MRSAGVALKNWINAGNNISGLAHLVTLTLRDGTTKYRWTNLDASIALGGFAFLSYPAGALVRVGSYSQTSRLEVDTFDLTIGGVGFTINGKTLAVLGVQGFFDGARVQVELLPMPTPGDVSLGSVLLFEGMVADADPGGTDVRLRCKSELEALNTTRLPRFLVAPSCGNTVYDQNCALVRATWTDAGTVASATTTAITTATAGIAAKLTDYYNLGSILFTSGALVGTRRSISKWNTLTDTFALALPLPAAPSAGDAFSVYPGCDRTRSVCSNRFNNLAQYRGFPHIPAPEGGS